jgi:hypothetical protein
MCTVLLPPGVNPIAVKLIIIIIIIIPLRMNFISYKICRENQNTNFTFNNLFSKTVLFRGNLEKYFGAGHGIDDNTTHALCILDN